jgi:hypothetical protein
MKPHLHYLIFALLLSFVAHASPKEDFLASLAPAQKSQASKQICVLEKLGWKFGNAPDSKEAKIISGNGICDVDTPEAAQRNGQLLLPQQLSSTELKDMLPKLLKSDASFCAFKMKHKAAIQKAVTKLQQAEKSKRYGFHSLDDLPGEHVGGPNAASLPASGWKKSGSCAFPKAGLGNAIQAIYSEHSITECATGLQIANLAVVWELFGAKADQLFSQNELRLDTWNRLIQSPNFWYDNVQNNSEEIKRYARLGPNALVGLSGVTAAANPGSVSNVHDTNENLLITNLDKTAAASIARTGVSGINSQLFNGGVLGLGNGTLQGTSIYVHPLSNTHNLESLRSRLRRINPQTRYHFAIYSTKTNVRLFDAFLKDASNQCN